MDKQDKGLKTWKKIGLLVIIILFLLGGISIKYLNKSTIIVSAIGVQNTLNIMGPNNPINEILIDKIKEYEEKTINIELENFRNELKEARIAEENRRLEEALRAEIEAKRVAKEKQKEEDKNKKIAYLTFDDGPSQKITKEIIEILDNYNIKATFFVIGKMAEENPEVLKLIYDKGHSIGSHSYSHNYGYIYKNTDNFLGELKATEKVFKSILGQDFETNLLRLPGGSFERYKKKYVEAAKDLDYINYDWNALNGDAEGKDLSVDVLVKRLKATIKRQRELIVLMHDTDSKRATVESLPIIIEHLIKDGYEFRALEQVKE